jgi:hypothetical protein
MVNFKRLSLTDYKVTIGLNASHKALVAAWTKADVLAKWNASSWAKRLEKRKSKDAGNDFERFKSMVQKRQVRRAVVTSRRRRVSCRAATVLLAPLALGDRARCQAVLRSCGDVWECWQGGACGCCCRVRSCGSCCC